MLTYLLYGCHLHEANYGHDVGVDYVDYDYAGYYRFGRVEQLLAT